MDDQRRLWQYKYVRKPFNAGYAFKQNPWKFEQAKLNRMLSRYGVSYTFVRDNLNEFNEPNNGSIEQFIVMEGIYHENEMHISTNATAKGEVRYRKQKQPLILCDYANAKKLKAGDWVAFGGVKYKVTNVRNVGNIGVYGDVSLEVVDDGGST